MPDARALEYYATPGPFTSLGRFASRFGTLPREPVAAVRVVQGLVMHQAHAGLYGVPPEALRNDEVQQRSAEEMLATVLGHDDAPLDRPRPPARRFVGNCRHFTTLLVALLRHAGVPARARCGFGTYFRADHYVDHWVAELWDEARGAWRLVDAQIDDPQRDAMSIAFDTMDVPRETFWVAGQAWQRCRAGAADPERFGIFDMQGLWFVRGNVVRDLAAFRKLELLPWDAWGVMGGADEGPGLEATFELVDAAAAVTTPLDPDFDELGRVYAREGLCVPRKITSEWPPPAREVELPI